MSVRKYNDNAPGTTLPAGIDNSQVSFAVASLVGFPSSTPWTATLDLGTASAEQVLVTTVVGTTVTVTRNHNGQGAFSHPAQSAFQHTANAIDFQEANAHINATTGVHGATGALVDTSSVQTVSSKTITASTLAAAATAATPGVDATVDADSSFVLRGKNHLGTVTSTLTGAGALSVASSTNNGNGTVAGTLGVTGAATFSSTLASGAQTVTGGVTASGTVQGATVTSTGAVNAVSAAISANETVGGTLGVTGNTTVSTLHATGTVTMDAAATADHVGLSSTTANALASTTTPYTAGPTAGQNVIGDQNGFQSRNNGAVSALGLNTLGGDMNVGAATSTINVPGKLNATIATDTNPGSIAANFTLTGAKVYNFFNGQLIHFRLQATYTGTAISPASGNISDTLCYTLNAAYRPTIGFIQFSFTCGDITGTGVIGTDGTVKMTSASDIIPNNGILYIDATFPTI